MTRETPSPALPYSDQLNSDQSDPVRVGPVLPTPGADPHAWLEDVDGEDALTWVRERNAEAEASLATPRFTELTEQILEVLDDDARVPLAASAGGHLFNFWRDGDHPRGLWRRTSLEEYARAAPEWEILLDLDELNRVENEDWVWSGASVLRPDATRALVNLSHGGADADVTREFDLTTGRFIDPADGGFLRPESKGALAWIDRDTVFAYTDFGPGTMTPSGYPRTVRRWRRGSLLEEAELVYEGEETDMLIGARHDRTPGFERSFVSRMIAFYDSEIFLLGPDDSLTLIGIPRSAEALVHREWLVVRVRDGWELGAEVHPGGSLLAIDFESFLAGDRSFDTLFAPSPTTSLASVTWTRHHLVLTLLSDVQNRLEVLTPPSGSEATWQRSALAGAPTAGTLATRAFDSESSDDLWVTATDFLTPTTVHLISAQPEPTDPPEGAAEVTGDVASTALKAMPSFFDSEDLVVDQHFVISADGTRVPYFLVHAKDIPMDGTTPTLLYGYGGFEISLTPEYSGTLGRTWLARGGAYALANIRGGGEYGPTWHQSALKGERHRAYADFAAVAQDLVNRNVTSPAHLAVKGGSNGGLLTGNMLAHYPELFGAIIIQVPLLDMFRFPHLLAGASWMAEYGNPDDPEEWEFIRTFSPYHLLEEGRTYPPVLLTTSTRDDRVHPGHARKMAALLRELGQDVTYFENIEGGHGGAADNAQAAYLAGLSYEFCWQHLS